MECFDCGSTFHLQKECPGKGAGKGSETALTGLIEYHDLAQFNELEGIYLIEELYATEFEAQTVEYMYYIHEHLGTQVSFSDWITGHSPFGEDDEQIPPGVDEGLYRLFAGQDYEPEALEELRIRSDPTAPAEVLAAIASPEGDSQHDDSYECRLCEDVEASDLYQRFMHNFSAEMTHGMIPDVPEIEDYVPEIEDQEPYLHRHGLYQGEFGLSPDPDMEYAQQLATALLNVDPAEQDNDDICSLVHTLTPDQLQLLDPVLEQIRTFNQEMRGHPILLRCYRRIALHWLRAERQRAERAERLCLLSPVPPDQYRPLEWFED